MSAAAASAGGRSRAIVLYRSLLRAHKKHLPPEMRHLGDTYVRSEFKLHKNAKQEHLTGFFQEWQNYLDEILMTARTKESMSMGSVVVGVDPSARDMVKEAQKFGRNLPNDMELSKEQQQQLEALKLEAEKLGRQEK